MADRYGPVIRRVVSRTMTTCKLNQYIEKWLAIVEKNKYETCNEQKLLAKYVRKCFASEDIIYR